MLLPLPMRPAARPPGGAPSFSPADLSPLAWWDVTDGDTVTTVGSNCSAVTDKSANSNNLTQTTDAIRVPYEASNAITGGPALVWPLGGSSRMDIASALSSREMYFVGAYGDGTTATFNNFNSIIEGDGTALAEKIHGVSGGTAWRTSGESPLNITYYRNGSTLASNVVLPAPFAVYSADYDAPVGGEEFTKLGGASTNRSWWGPVSEVIIFSAKLSAEDRTTLLDYLYAKHGITP